MKFLQDESTSDPYALVGHFVLALSIRRKDRMVTWSEYHPFVDDSSNNCEFLKFWKFAPTLVTPWPHQKQQPEEKKVIYKYRIYLVTMIKSCGVRKSCALLLWIRRNILWFLSWHHRAITCAVPSVIRIHLHYATRHPWQGPIHTMAVPRGYRPWFQTPQHQFFYFFKLLFHYWNNRLWGPCFCDQTWFNMLKISILLQ